MSMQAKVTVYAPGRTARHEAAFTWVLGSVLGLEWQWADTEKAYVQSTGWRCHYGADPTLDGVGFPADGMLSELGQMRPEPPQTEGEQADLFAAVFWMASRMEEFLPDAPRDQHGRFMATHSIPVQRGWLDHPICEHWAFAIGERLLGAAWPDHEATLKAQFEVVPTLDVDSAYAFRGKGGWRTGGALLRDLATGHWPHAARRFRVIQGREEDPYDTYQQAEEWHRDRGLRAKWFFLLAKFGPHDKGLPAGSPLLKERMQRLDSDPDQEVHWHPGYAAAADATAMAREQADFTRIMGRPPLAARQHYLRLMPTATRRALLALGISEDHTEGHAMCTGFRGGFSRSRPWYDLEAEKLTTLKICPFAAMDATFLRYLNAPPSEVPEAVGQLADAVRSVGGTLRLLWHNESLAPEGQWSQWAGVYPAVLDAALGTDA